MENEKKILFCNIAQMIDYQGITKDDKPRYGGEFVEKTGKAHESCNFSPNKGTYYGYVRPSGEKSIKIENLGASGKDCCSVSGVTVIWTARRIDRKRGTTIIGWYENATVFRRYKDFTDINVKPSRLQSKDGITGCRIKASICKPLPVHARLYEIPRGSGGMSRNNIWYGNNSYNKRVLEFIRFVNSRWGDGDEDVVNAVREYMGIQENKPSQASNHGWGGTPEDKKKVEEAAIKRCKRYYEKNYKVKDVQTENKGWDLQAESNNELLRIEVKGVSTSSPSVMLTPNEYKALKEYESSYHLAVVTNACEEKYQKLFICSHDGKQKGWKCQLIEGNEEYTLNIDERIHASIKLQL